MISLIAAPNSIVGSSPVLARLKAFVDIPLSRVSTTTTWRNPTSEEGMCVWWGGAGI